MHTCKISSLSPDTAAGGAMKSGAQKETQRRGDSREESDRGSDLNRDPLVWVPLGGNTFPLNFHPKKSSTFRGPRFSPGLPPSAPERLCLSGDPCLSLPYVRGGYDSPLHPPWFRLGWRSRFQGIRPPCACLFRALPAPSDIPDTRCREEDTPLPPVSLSTSTFTSTCLCPLRPIRGSFWGGFMV